jgi:hypothetical protein
MYLKKRSSFAASATTAGLLLANSVCFSQTTDSASSSNIPQKVIRYAADRFPTTRMLMVEYSQVGSFRYSFKPSDATLPKNKVDNQRLLKVNVNLNLIKKQKWMLGAIFSYRYMTATAEAPGFFSGTAGLEKNGFHYHSTGINAAYFSKLFNKMTIYSGSLIVDGSDQHFERIKGRVTGTIVLKASAQTKITASLTAIIDPSTALPVLPTFSYEHRFANGLMVDALLPQRLMIKKDVFNKGRVSLGSELTTNSFYLYNIDSTSRKYEFRQTELNSGIMYEHLIGKYFSAFIKTGIKNSMNARIFKKSESVNDFIFEAKPNAALYLNIGLSVNPFAKPKKSNAIK